MIEPHATGGLYEPWPGPIQFTPDLCVPGPGLLSYFPQEAGSADEEEPLRETVFTFGREIEALEKRVGALEEDKATREAVKPAKPWRDPIFRSERHFALCASLVGLMAAAAIAVPTLMSLLTEPGGMTAGYRLLLWLATAICTLAAPPLAWLLATWRLANPGALA